MVAIAVDDLTRTYRLYDKPSHRLKEIILRRPSHREFTALEGISFSLKRGETLGIIGENGAGKSTLLKILARTLCPTRGKLQINGRVSSLLELGSGFHPEFTGLENILFYGALLGLERKLMEEKIEEIVQFSELGDFINYPIKTYSSGMYVRLAFSVVTAIDPDILIVDEALSVGDLHFQKKGTEKILSFKEAGKTIVFCSHSMYHINRLCDRVIWLKNGRITMEGPPHPVTQAYETYELKKESPEDARKEQRPLQGSGNASLVPIRNITAVPFPTVRSGDTLAIEIEVEPVDDSIPYRVAAVLKRIDGIDIIGVGTREYEPFRGRKSVTLSFPSLQLKEGTFFVDIYAMDEKFVQIFDLKATPPFTVPKETIELGFLNLPYKWTV